MTAAVPPAEVLDGDYEARVPLDRLIPHPRNARRGNIGKIEKLIRANGFVGAVKAQRSTGFIFAGNHSYEAARNVGLEAIPVLWYDLDDGETLDRLLGDNAGSDGAAYDEEVLVELLAEREASAAGLAGTGWTSTQFEELLDRLGRDVGGARPDREPDDAPPRPPKAAIKSQPGDVYLLGRHRLVCGDSTNPDVIERALAGGLADMVWTDPPYGVDYQGGSRAEAEGTERERIENDALELEDLGRLLRSVLGNARTWLRPGGAFWCAGPSGPPTGLLFAQVLTELKVWRQVIVWVKDTHVIGRQDYQHRHEVLYEGVAEDLAAGGGLLDDLYVYAGWNPGAAHTAPPNRTQTNVWEIARPRAAKEHPTMKPVELVERAVRNHSAPGETVLDPFAGSGTTLVACERSGRRACLVEKAPGYADVIARRWQELTDIVPVLEATGAARSFL